MDLIKIKGTDFGEIEFLAALGFGTVQTALDTMEKMLNEGDSAGAQDILALVATRIQYFSEELVRALRELKAVSDK